VERYLRDEVVREDRAHRRWCDDPPVRYRKPRG